MKIGIITQPLATNYGGLLQNYALQESLRRLGHTPITINQYWPLIPKKNYLIKSAKNIVKRIIGRKYTPLVYIKDNDIKTISVNTDKFINNYLTCTKRVSRLADYRKVIAEENLEAIIVGSDQVWRPIYCRNIERSYLNFAEGFRIKRIAYAASFGVDEWEYSNEQTQTCKELVKKFEAVSVREEGGIKLCQDFLDINAKLVLDPTMLLDKEDYIKLVDISEIPQSNGNLFTYILDMTEEKQAYIEKVAQKTRLTPFTAMPAKGKEYIKTDIGQCVYPPVEQWLRAFMDAEFVVCDSFHGAVFSIIFNKPFIIIGNKERGMSRFHSLTKLFSLEERLISDFDNIEIIEKHIDWGSINEKREQMKTLSFNFIKEGLK